MLYDDIDLGQPWLRYWLGVICLVEFSSLISWFISFSWVWSVEQNRIIRYIIYSRSLHGLNKKTPWNNPRLAGVSTYISGFIWLMCSNRPSNSWGRRNTENPSKIILKPKYFEISFMYNTKFNYLVTCNFASLQISLSLFLRAWSTIL